MYLVNAQDRQETQTLFFTCDNLNTIPTVYSELSTDLTLPKMINATVSDNRYTGLYWDKELNNSVWFTPYGRFFSTDEMDSGSDVVILGTSYFANLSPTAIDSIWSSGINVNNRNLIATGNYYFYLGDSEADELSPIHTAITMPIKTYFNLGLSPTKFRCVFSHSLTNSQIAHLAALISSADGVQYVSLLKPYEIEAVNSFVNAMAQYTFILIVSLLVSASVLLYWLQKEFARYKIYLICGARGRQISYFLSINIVLLVTIAFACSYLIVAAITFVSPPGVISALPWQFYPVMYLAILVFMLVVVNTRSYPLVFREKMLGE